MWAVGGLGALMGLIGGIQSSQQNAEIQRRVDDLYGKQGQAIDSMTGYASPMQQVINQQQAALGGYGQINAGLGDLLSQLGGSGSGTQSTWGGMSGGAGPDAYGRGGSPRDLMSGIRPGMPMGEWMGDPSKAPVSTPGTSAPGATPGAAPRQGSLMDQLMQLYSSAQGQKPLTASDNGAGGGLMGNAGAVLGATDPSAYQRQAQLAGDRALGQLNAQMAARGVSGGASARLGASTLAGLYADANAKGNQDRLQAYGLSNQAMGQAGQLGLGMSQLQNSMNNDHMSLLQSLLGMRSNIIGQQAGIMGQQGQMLSGYLGGLGNINGQYGQIAGLYNNAATQYGNAASGQASNINPNPWGGMTAGFGALGNALASMGMK